MVVNEDYMQEIQKAVYVLFKIVYFRRTSPITLSTWMRRLAMDLVVFSSSGSSWDFPLVNAGITILLANILCNSEPLSAFTISPGNKYCRNHNSL